MTKTIITATPPTPNGDLHVGHLSGPYLAADVHARFLRSRGRDVTYVSSSDDNQSYVVTSAKRLGVEPGDLALGEAARIRQTLERASIAIDAFTTPDDRHVEVVQRFFLRLFESGAIRPKRKKVLWCRQHGHYAFESYLSGTCSHCFSPTAGAICEACGHPNDAATILDPQCSIDSSHQLEPREVELMVLELERFRDQIRDFYADKSRAWRPHPIRLVDELLAAELPDYPITYISNWGIPAPFPGFEGHVLNVWAEMLPGLIRTAEYAEAQRKGRNVSGEAMWRRDSGNELVQFLGYDNSFFFAVVHLALALACDEEQILPTSIMTNEFYQLNNFKFSTSKGNVIWVRDLLEERAIDEVRFYLAFSNPEYQKTNFTRAEMDRLVGASFTGPWQRLAATLGRMSPEVLEQSFRRTAMSPEGAALADHLIANFARGYAIETFSLQRVAELLSQLLNWMGSCAETAAAAPDNCDQATVEMATVWTIIRLLPALTAPLLPDFAARLDKALQQSTLGHWPDRPTPVNGASLPDLAGILPAPRHDAR